MVCRIDIQATKMAVSMRKKWHNEDKEQEWDVDNGNKRRKGERWQGRVGWRLSTHPVS